jgi:Tfp pilus assembly protein PilF
MNCNATRILSAILFATCVLTAELSVRAQNSVGAITRPAITVLDSTKEQDGLAGSVRRVKTETAKIEFKDGHAVEGPAQLVEVTTYGIKGNRIENTSYPLGSSLVGKEEYKYDKRGNITEMTLRDDRGAIVSREAYSYEFDKFGNWTKMVTSLVVFENGQLKREPVEVTSRTITYYFDDSVAKIVDEPERPAVRRVAEIPTARAIPELGFREIRDVDVLKVGLVASSTVSTKLAGDPPPVLTRSKPEGAESVFAARKATEVERSEVVPENTNIPDQKGANDFYLTGRNRFDAGDIPGAVESYLQSIKLEPRSAEVYLNLGHAYLKLEKDRDAIKAFRESIKLNPAVAETHYGVGLASFRSGRFKEAADAFKKATTLSPKLAKAHYGLSLAYQELGMTHELMAEYRILETLDASLARKLTQTFPQYNFSCRMIRGCP